MREEQLTQAYRLPVGVPERYDTDAAPPAVHPREIPPLVQVSVVHLGRVQALVPIEAADDHELVIELGRRRVAPVMVHGMHERPLVLRRVVPEIERLCLVLGS